MADRMTTHPRQIMLMCGAVVAMTLLVAPVASAKQKNDNDVKNLLERIDEERDRFEDHWMERSSGASSGGRAAR